MNEAMRDLVERQIAKAREDGQMDGLAGEGKPLPDRDPTLDPAMESSFKIMAEAGVLPEEIALKKQLAAKRAAYTSESDDTKRKALMRELADLEMRYNISMDARRKFLR
ncbi:DUF1992 domain-containing protein [Planktotalea sp.]|uniref:DnaJ family domain-containing protein n=1 Tax=Planktotalea sp. TaxID=2029877 RepID=UPI003D6ACEC6